MNNNVARLANILGCVKINNLEVIAKNTIANNKDEYLKKYAENIFLEKLDASKLSYTRTGEHDFLDYGDEKFLLLFSPGKILPKDGKEYVKQYAHRIDSVIKHNNFSGVIYFMPFLMNNNFVRDVMKKELNIGFVNMPYDEKGLERRIAKYSR